MTEREYQAGRRAIIGVTVARVACTIIGISHAIGGEWGGVAVMAVIGGLLHYALPVKAT